MEEQSDENVNHATSDGENEEQEYEEEYDQDEYDEEEEEDVEDFNTYEEEKYNEYENDEYDEYKEDTVVVVDGSIQFPVALEQALALKSERAKQIGNELESAVEVNEVQTKLEDSHLDDAEDEFDQVEEEKVKSKDKKKEKSRRKKKKKKKPKRHTQIEETKVDDEGSSSDEKEEPEVVIEYVPEMVNIHQLAPMYRQFARILDSFRLSDSDARHEPLLDVSREIKLAQELGAKSELADLKKVPKLPDDYDEDEIKQDGEKKEKMSKRKLKKLTRLSVAELKQLVNRPDVVEMHDVTARDPKLLVQLKAHRNTVPVPRHWCFKRKYLQGKRGIEKPPFELPDFIRRTGIMEMRSSLQESEEQKTLKAKMRERARPKLGKIDIDYQKLHDAFFKWQTKPKLTIHGDLYYEGKEFETKLREKKPGDLSDELRTALGMPVGPNAQKVPPPWLIAMQRYGPPPSYPSLRIPGLNAPIPDGCSFGYHAGGWGKPPVDESGKPLYGDVFGTQNNVPKTFEMEEEVDKSIWGELESSEEEESEEEEEEEESEIPEKDETGIATPAEGLATPSGITSIPAGIHTPDIIELRKRKIEAEMEIGDAPPLYQVLPEKRVDKVGGAMMASTHIYEVAPSRRSEGTVELTLDPSELDLDNEAMAVRYEQQIRQQQSQLQKEDLTDMLTEHVARQKSKRKKQQQQDNSKPSKKYKEFKF